MSSPKKTTRKLTGRAKDRFFESGLSPEEAKAAVTSLRVRKEAWPVSRDVGPRIPLLRQPKSAQTPHTPSTGATQADPIASQDHAAEPAPEVPEKAFDPFQFGLVPIFKREGLEGLTARLMEIDDVDNLRTMAREQQIVLPRSVRRGEADIETVRAAVISAVEQRVADRKAQL